MYKTISIFIFTIITSLLSGQKNIDQIFRKYKNDEGVSNMNFTGEILNMLNSSKVKLSSTIDGVDVYLFDKKNDVESDDKSKIQTVLTRDKFDLLIDVKSDGQKIKLYAIDNGKYLSKIYAYVNAKDMNAYFVMSGKIVFEELAKMGMDFQNGKFLDVLNKKDKP